MGPTGPRGEPGLPGPAGMGRAVIDANDVLVGEVIQLTPTAATVIAELGGYLFGLRVTADGSIEGIGIGGAVLEFTTTDCSGRPVSSYAAGPTFLTPVVVSAPGNTLYAPDARATPRSYRVRSSRDATGTCTSANRATFGVRLRTLGDLNSMFTPPFRLQ